MYENIHQLYNAGYSYRNISRILKCSRHTVSKFLNADMQSVCSPELTSGVDQFRDYIIKALNQGICRSSIYRELLKLGLRCGKTAAYEYMNKLADFYDIEVSLMRDCVPVQKEKQKQIQKYDYLSRKNVFRFLWMGEPLDACHLSYLQKSPLLYHVHGRNRPPSRSGRPVHITVKNPW